MEKKLTYYDIYGFVLAVDGGMKKAFNLEYWRFRTKSPAKVDLYVLKSDKKNLPIKLRHDTRGIYIPFGKNENQVFYEEGVRPDWVLYSIEPMIRWKDKCFLHCGAVSKDGVSLLFPAEGGVGKTTMAMYLVTKGFEYLSDDWLIIGSDGKSYPFFKTLHLYDYNIKRDKKLSKRILGPGKYYYNLTKINLLDAFQAILPHRFFRIVIERLKPIFSVDVSDLHPGAKLGSVSKINRIYWLKKDENIIKPLLKKSSADKLAERMPYITALETNHFYKNYLEWAYHNYPNEFFDNRVKIEKEIMKKAFAGCEVYELFVPKKINPEQVYSLLKLNNFK